MAIFLLYFVTVYDNYFIIWYGYYILLYDYHKGQDFPAKSTVQVKLQPQWNLNETVGLECTISSFCNLDVKFQVSCIFLNWF